jgi:hypothetical protein
LNKGITEGVKYNSNLLGAANQISCSHTHQVPFLLIYENVLESNTFIFFKETTPQCGITENHSVKPSLV